MSPLPNWKTFVKAGDAPFTAENETTGKRLTVPQSSAQGFGPPCIRTVGTAA